MLKRFLVVTAAVTFAIIAQAQTTMTRLRGTIEAVDGSTVTVKTRDNKIASVTMDAGYLVTGVKTAALTDIKPGSYVGCTSIPQADGTQNAVEVHIFPASMAGAGEGSRPWDLYPNSSMTNGAVGDFVAASGRVMTVKYAGGEKKIVVPDDVTIVSMEVVDASLVKPGAHVVVFAKKAEDGTLSAGRITVGENGIVPPT